MPSKATGTYKKLDLTYEPTTLDLEFWPIKAKRLLCPQAILLNRPITNRLINFFGSEKFHFI